MQQGPPALALLTLAALTRAVEGGHGHSHSHSHGHGHDEAHVEHGTGAQVDMGMVKVGAMLSIVAVKVVFGLAPRHFSSNAEFLGLANAFSAGIFLAGGLCHLLPEAAAAFDDLPKAWEQTFPEHFAFACSGAGFMLTLLLERVLMAAPESGAAELAKKRTLKDSDDEGVELALSSVHGTGHGHSHGAHGHCHMPASLSPDQPMLPLVLTAVLSFHSFMGGVALGVQSDVHQTFLVWLAIVTHKWVEAFSLGVNFVKANLSKSAHCKFLAPFTLSSPGGIAFGWTVHSLVSGDSARVCVAVLDAVASGTFIYIATVDLIGEEIAGRKIVSKYVCLVAGFVGFVILSAAFHQPH